MTQSVIEGNTLQYERVWARSSRCKSTLALTHPTAVLMFSAATVALACIAARGIPPGLTLVYLVFAMAFAQCAIGIWNEVFDRDLDRVAKPWRAIPAGYIGVRSAALVGLAAILLAVFLAAQVSTVSMILLGLGMGIGILYSAALKRSVLSWVAHVTAYPSLPVWVWASLGRFDDGLLVVYLLACPLALAFHFANQLCDYDEDAAMGIKSLVQRLGKATSVRACRYLLVIAPVPLLAWGVLAQTAVSGWVVIFAAVIAYGKLVIPVLPQPGSPPEAYRTIFQRLQFAGPLLLVGWILAGQT